MVRTNPLSSLVSLIWAPVITALAGSCTVPESAQEMFCASNAAGTRSDKHSNAALRILRTPQLTVNSGADYRLRTAGCHALAARVNSPSVLFLPITKKALVSERGDILHSRGSAP